MEGIKKFGLILPKKIDIIKKKPSAIFDNSSDEEISESTSKPKIPQSKSVFTKNAKLKHLEDPSMYEYDSIYDDMKEKQIKETVPKEKQNSRYIDSLLKAADKRKKQYERRIEKKIQVEREKEGDEFKDKEAFVTSSYKKKMQEIEEEEERERRENQINDMMDVTKQKDLSGFYRHFLKQTVGEEKIPVYGDSPHIKEEILSDSEQNSIHKTIKSKLESSTNEQEVASKTPKINIDADCDLKSSSDEEELNSGNIRKGKISSRKRTSEFDYVKCTPNTADNLINKDSDAISSDEKENDKSIENARSYEENSNDKSDYQPYVKQSKKRKTEVVNLATTIENHDSSEDSGRDKNEKLSVDNLKPVSHDEYDLSDHKKLEVQRNIFEKRTVGAVFADAQARYFKRMAAREDGI